jgi:hypothetical protein
MRGLLQLGEQVVDALASHGQTHQSFVDAKTLEHVLWPRGVRHDRGMFDLALDAAKALGEREELEPRRRADGPRGGATLV